MKLILPYLALLLLTACGATGDRDPDLGALYLQAARYEGLERNPIVVIPGLLGSRLVDRDSGRVVWGAFDGNFADPRGAEGANLMALPMGMGIPLDQLRDGVVPDGALETLEVSIFGLPFQLDAYRSILMTLGAGGYIDKDLVQAARGLAGAGDLGDEDLWGNDHFTCFQFAYDWRRGIPENAQQLSIFLERRAVEVQAERAKRFGPAAGLVPVEFDLVCHSLGGLVARWYLRYGEDTAATGQAGVPWTGASRVDKCVLVATPNLGSSQALSDMVHGMNLGSFAADYSPAILGTLPTSYQLLPSGPGTLVDASSGAASADATGEAKMADIFSPALWQELGWGLASKDAEPVLAQLLPEVEDPNERRAIALDHQRKCLEEARRVANALGMHAARPLDLDLILFAGDALETSAQAQFLGRGDLWTRSSLPGDGTVTRASALGDQRTQDTWTPRLQSHIDWSQVTFLFRDHIGVVSDPAFVDNLLYQLLEQPD